jgi:biotin carboxylase
VLGVVDSRVHERHGSFLQFDYPSRLPAEALRECERVAAAVARAHGLRDTFFNVELFWDQARGRAGVVELNPRLCGQFADLHQKVDGVHTYVLACAVACGLPAPVQRGGGAFAAAASVPLRVFAPCRVETAPDAAALARVEAATPGLHVWTECAAGDELWDFAAEDGVSIRYAVLNLGGRGREQIEVHGRELADRLGWAFTPLPRC